jgi:hypothetical protein
MATSTVAAGGGSTVQMAGTQIVTKNGVALVQDTDYTVDSQTQVTLIGAALPILLTDTVEIITPTHFAFNLFEPTAIIAGDQKHVTNIFNFGDVAAETGTTVLASPTLTDKLALHGSLVIGDYSVWDDPGTSLARAIIGGNFVGDNVIPNGELVLGHGFALTTGNILGQVSFYSSDATAGAGGRQVAIKAISDDPANSGDRAALAFYTGTGTQDGQVERWRMSSSGALMAGTTAPFGSALVQLESTTKAFMMPSMTTAQRDAIVNPQERMEIWNNETKKKNIYDGTAWRVVTMT